MKSFKIPMTEVVEGNYKAQKDTDDFGGVNMWRLKIKNTRGQWKGVQWMDVSNIQEFFNETLPVYKKTGTAKLEKIK